jgi:CBS domain-containing protein
MPMLLGTKGKDILQWRASAELTAALKGSLARKWARCSAREAEGFLDQLIASLQEDISYEDLFQQQLDELDRAIDHATAPADLQQLQLDHRRVIGAHFQRRQSVLAVCDACNRLHDAILNKAVYLAQERMLQMGQGAAPPHALLVAGPRGRGEQTLGNLNRYLLLHDERSPHFFLFSHQLAGTLKEAGLLKSEQMFWHGSLKQWHAFMDEGFRHTEEQELALSSLLPFAAPMQSAAQELPDLHWRLETMTDLSFLQGDPELAGKALKAAELTLQEEHWRAPFLQLARRVVGLPLAVGRFGRWRLQRNGAQRGRLNLDELALGPLVACVRVLAVHAGAHCGGTLDRMETLLTKGALDVELAERLLKAYQCFMQQKIQQEITSPESGPFCDPELFDESDEARFRNSLAAVLNLQKIGYQRMVVQG